MLGISSCLLILFAWHDDADQLIPIAAAVPRPLLLVHVISAPREILRREVLRLACPFGEDARGYFVTGRPAPVKERDILALNLDDLPEAMSHKRQLALKAAVQQPDWTYYLQMDSDSFVRYGPLLAWLDAQNVSDERVMWGRYMTIEPERHRLPGYGYIYYPGGMGVAMTRPLVECLAALPAPLLASYPFDDVALGIWIGDCNGTRTVHTTDFHDWPNQGGNPRAITPASLIIHHIDATQMLWLRDYVSSLA